MEQTLRLNRTNSYSSNDKDLKVNIDLKQTSTLLPFDKVEDKVDAYQVFLNERSTCNKYRLTLTINPFCSNILYNACTEIIKDEGSENQIVFDDDNGINISDKVIGKKENVMRNDMVYNTEYSKGSYTYHPGLDIFDNHLLRNTSFRMVNNTKRINERTFNTLEDKMRYNDGTIVKTFNRVAGDITKVPIKIEKHLYEESNILSFENSDSINNSLRVINGWYGFKNKTNINTKVSENNYLNINKIINNRSADEFIDMYPDRTLYSFVPKFNKYRNRYEKNWDILLTYPYENTKEHGLIQKKYNVDGKDVVINGLLVMSIEKKIGTMGEDITMFRTYTKHGLKRNETFNLYYDGKKFKKTYQVYDVGDLQHDYKENYFYINDITIYDEIFGDNILSTFYVACNKPSTAMITLYDDEPTDIPTEKENYIGIACRNNNDGGFIYDGNGKTYNYYKLKGSINEIILNKFDKIEFRVIRTVGDIENEYYIRKFKKLPFIKNEEYKLSFANTIYGDEIAQVTYTDSIDIEKLKNNRNMGITDIYMTVLKRNKGNKEWFEKDYSNKNIEFSHCFSDLTYGFNFLRTKYDRNVNKNQKMLDYNCVSMIYDTQSLGEKNINVEKDDFFGDLVSYNTTEAREIILEDVYFRFNTIQREWETNNYKFVYHELVSDDYDGEFKVKKKIYNENFNYITLKNVNILTPLQKKDNEYYYYVKTDDGQFYSWNGKMYEKVDLIYENMITRHEGYFYKAHYKIPLRELGNLQQDSNISARISYAKPIQNEQIEIEVRNDFRHCLDINDIIFICDDKENKKYTTSVCDVIDEFTFTFLHLSHENWIETSDKLNDGTYRIRFKNTNIPDYATEIGKNTYIWRNILRVGDKDIKELEEYPFSNDNFYVDNSFNFFLRRQDPFGYNDLRVETKENKPGDIEGEDMYNTLKESMMIFKNKEYKDPDTYKLC